MNSDQWCNEKDKEVPILDSSTTNPIMSVLCLKCKKTTLGDNNFITVTAKMPPDLRAVLPESIDYRLCRLCADEFIQFGSMSNISVAFEMPKEK